MNSIYFFYTMDSACELMCLLYPVQARYMTFESRGFTIHIAFDTSTYTPETYSYAENVYFTGEGFTLAIDANARVYIRTKNDPIGSDQLLNTMPLAINYNNISLTIVGFEAGTYSTGSDSFDIYGRRVTVLPMFKGVGKEIFVNDIMITINSSEPSFDYYRDMIKVTKL